MVRFIFLQALMLVLPSPLKVFLLRALGHKVGKGCYFGFSIISADKLTIGDHVYIGHLNVIWRLQEFSMDKGSRVSHMNWITGAYKGSFSLGQNSSISRRHFIDAASDLTIGSNTIVAGLSSQFFTHGISPDNIYVGKSIRIGHWCYIGSAVRVIPGVEISDHTFVGMGAVITKSFEEEYVLLVGSPAIVKKTLPKDSIFFNRTHLTHSHHPSDYKG